MAIQTIAASTLSVTTTLPTTFSEDNLPDTKTAVAAIADWKAIGEVSNVAGHGDEYTEVTYDTITRRRTRKLKGTVNGGTETYTLGDDIADTGQAELKVALSSDANAFFKETWQDGTIEYFLGKVMSFASTGGGPNTVRERTCSIGIDSETIDSVQLA